MIRTQCRRKGQVIDAWLKAHAQRGKGLRDLLEQTPQQLTQSLRATGLLPPDGESQSVFNAHSDLRDNGWTSVTDSTDNVFRANGQCPISSLMQRLQLSTAAQENTMVTITQSQGFRKGANHVPVSPAWTICRKQG